MLHWIHWHGGKPCCFQLSLAQLNDLWHSCGPLSSWLGSFLPPELLSHLTLLACQAATFLCSVPLRGTSKWSFIARSHQWQLLLLTVPRVFCSVFTHTINVHSLIGELGIIMITDIRAPAPYNNDILPVGSIVYIVGSGNHYHSNWQRALPHWCWLHRHSATQGATSRPSVKIPCTSDCLHWSHCQGTFLNIIWCMVVPCHRFSIHAKWHQHVPNHVTSSPTLLTHWHITNFVYRCLINPTTSFGKTQSSFTLAVSCFSTALLSMCSHLALSSLKWTLFITSFCSIASAPLSGAPTSLQRQHLAPQINKAPTWRKRVRNGNRIKCCCSHPVLQCM